MSHPEEKSPIIEEVYKSFKITIQLNEKTRFPLEVTPNDHFHEIKQFLSESSELYLYTSFHFECNGTTINEFEEIRNIDIKEEDLVKIVLDLYDERTSRAHVKKVQELLNTPSLIPSILGNVLNNQQLAAKPNEKEENKQENQTKNDAEKILNLNQFVSPNLTIYQTLNDKQAKEETSETLSCVNHLNFSGFNPPMPNRKLQGDFFYLTLRTLEGSDFHITANPYGFYLNSSNLRYFSHKTLPNTKVFITLFDLISSLSPKFTSNLEKLLNSSPKWDLIDLPRLSFFKYGHKWLLTSKDLIRIQNNEWNMNKCESFLQNLHGLDPASMREWNEELQVCRDLPKQDFFQRLNRDKSLIKSHGDFLDAAIEGAKAIVNKIINPLNPSDNKLQHVFVYNNLFFSYAMETPDSFRQETGIEASPTTSSTNADLRNLKLLHRLDIPGLHLLNSAIVDYKGYRVLAQSIIPGILNTDHNICTIYGSIDDGKTIYKNEEFHEIMKKVCENFYLDDDSLFTDEKGEKISLAGSIEIKGLLGSDRKKYILDLMRLNPRDLNYVSEKQEDKDKYLCCVIRTELISSFVITKNIETASQAINKEYEELNKNEKIDEKTLKAQSLEKLMKLQEFFQGHKLEKQGKYKFNPNIETKAKMVDSEKILVQKTELKELSDFLINQSIPNLINDLINGETIRLTDSFSVQEIFHSHGINMRYLGKIIKKIDFKEHPHLKILLERVILVKCLKYIFKNLMREATGIYFLEALAHLLNCVFANNNAKKAIENGLLQQCETKIIEKEKESEKIETTVNVVKPKKNKNKKKKKNTGENKNVESKKDNKIEQIIFKSERPKILDIKPSEIWIRVNEIALNRYDYQFENKYEDFQGFKLNFTKLAILRDLCLTIGLQLECKDYQINENNTAITSNEAINVTNLPFQPENIVEITPVVKHLDILSEDVQANMDVAQKFLMEGKVKEGLEAYQNSIQLLLNLYGPLHKDVGLCYAKIANIYYKTGDLENALLFQKQSLNTLKKLFGLDHYYTVQAISNLGLFYFSLKIYDKAFKYLLKSLYLINLIGGESHPDSFLTFMNLSLMYQESQQHQAALNCLYEALDRNITVFGPNHVKVAITYQAIALSHFEIDDLKRAVEYQERCCNILASQVNAEDPRLKESNIYLQKFKKSLTEKQKNQNNKNVAIEGQNKRPFGSNKPVSNKKEENGKDVNQNEGFPFKQDRDFLLHKLKIAKMNAKYGFRKNNNALDWNRFLMNQQNNYYDNLPQNQQDLERMFVNSGLIDHEKMTLIEEQEDQKNKKI